MNRACDQFLAGAALALDQDIGGQVAHLSDNLEDTLHRRTLTDDVLKPIARLHFGAQPLELLLQSFLFDRPLCLDQNFIIVERFGDVMKRTRAHRLDSAFDRSEGGDEQHQRATVDLAQALNQFDASHLRHHEVGDRQIEPRRSIFIERGLAVISHVGFVAVLAQKIDQELTHPAIVVDDQNAPGFEIRLVDGGNHRTAILVSDKASRFCIGSRMANRVNCPGLLSTRISPP